MDYSKLSKQELITLLECRDKEIECKTSDILFERLKKYADDEQEKFVTIALDSALKIKNEKLIGIGTISKTIVSPTDIFRFGILNNARAVIVAHSHPSGNLSPSVEDIEITQRIISTGKIIGIQVLDHVIFSKTGFRSMAEEGDIYFG